MKKTVRLQDLVEDDEWFKENEWDELYNMIETPKVFAEASSASKC